MNNPQKKCECCLPCECHLQCEDKECGREKGHNGFHFEKDELPSPTQPDTETCKHIWSNPTLEDGSKKIVCVNCGVDRDNESWEEEFEDSSRKHINKSIFEYAEFIRSGNPDAVALDRHYIAIEGTSLVINNKTHEFRQWLKSFIHQVSEKTKQHMCCGSKLPWYHRMKCSIINF